MKTTIEQLKIARPEVAVIVTWEIDHDYEWDGDGPDPIKEGYYPHTVDVVAYAIREGKLYEGCASLGGCYSKGINYPDIHGYLDGINDPDIHGYLDQLVNDAVRDLDERLTGK